MSILSQPFGRVDAEDSQAGFERIGIERDEAEAVLFVVRADDLVFLIVAVELLGELEKIVADVVRFELFGRACYDFVIFAKFAYQRPVFLLHHCRTNK